MKNLFEMNLFHKEVSDYVRLYIKIELDKFDARIEKYKTLLSDTKKYDIDKISTEVLALKFGISKSKKEEEDKAVEKDKEFVENLGEIIIPSAKKEEKSYKIGSVTFGKKVNNT